MKGERIFQNLYYRAFVLSIGYYIEGIIRTVNDTSQKYLFEFAQVPIKPSLGELFIDADGLLFLFTKTDSTEISDFHE